jgi:hypothetical protein
VPLIAYSRGNYGQIKIDRALLIQFGPGPIAAGLEVVPTLRGLAAYIRETPIARLAKFA